MNTVIYEADYIVGTANTSFGKDASADEIEEILRHQPRAEAGYVYRLRADTLDWELCELSHTPDTIDEDADYDDYEEALGRFGV